MTHPRAIQRLRKAVALPQVFRGADPTAVAAAVRKAARDGLVLAPGPYRYPYAGVVQLLRQAGLFTDPTADTADDMMLSRMALCDHLWTLVRRAKPVAVTRVDLLDAASAGLLAAVARVMQLASDHGLNAGTIVLGTTDEMPQCLQLPDAVVHDLPGKPAPMPALSNAAARVYAVLQAAPHPVLETSLVFAADIGARATGAALRELSSADLVTVGERIALGPAGCAEDTAAAAWQESSEARMPLARLALQPEPSQAMLLARQAVQRGEHEIAQWCRSRALPTEVADVLVLAEAAAELGQGQTARQLIAGVERAELKGPELLQLGRVLAALAGSGAAQPGEAEAVLREAERAGLAVAARPIRAGLMLAQGKVRAAQTLLRRTKKRELEFAAAGVSFLYDLISVRCLAFTGDRSGATKLVGKRVPLCASRQDLRNLLAAAGDPTHEERSALLALQDLIVPSDATPRSISLALSTLLNVRDVA